MLAISVTQPTLPRPASSTKIMARPLRPPALMLCGARNRSNPRENRAQPTTISNTQSRSFIVFFKSYSVLSFVFSLFDPIHAASTSCVPPLMIRMQGISSSVSQRVIVLTALFTIHSVRLPVPMVTQRQRADKGGKRSCFAAFYGAVKWKGPSSARGEGPSANISVIPQLPEAVGYRGAAGGRRVRPPCSAPRWHHLS